MLCFTVVKPQVLVIKLLSFGPPDLTLGAPHRKLTTVYMDKVFSHKKEYVEWITEAKREETRLKRMATALEWMAKGKPRHWKYAHGC